jgi:V-type H+-transporting ATPase subunit C
MLRLQATSQHGTGPSQYVKEFAWKRDVYPLEEAIPSLLQKLAGEGPQAEERCRSLLVSYSDKNTRLQNAQRRLQGNLSSRSIREAVGSWARRQRLPDDKPLETDFLTTLFVAVPRAEQEQFVATYADVDDHIVPASLSVVAQDGEFVLNAIVCFKRPQPEGDKKLGSVDEIRQKLRKARFHVRDVTAADELSQQALEQLEREVLADKARLVALLQQQYSRCYVAWVHTKALRLYVEAVLKYGAQGKFVTALVSAESEKTSHVLRRLREIYADFANPVMRAGTAGSAAAESAAVLDSEGPFVALKLANILRTR